LRFPFVINGYLPRGNPRSSQGVIRGVVKRIAGLDSMRGSNIELCFLFGLSAHSLPLSKNSASWELEAHLKSIIIDNERQIFLGQPRGYYSDTHGRMMAFILRVVENLDY